MKRTILISVVLVIGFSSATILGDDEPVRAPSENWKSFMKSLPPTLKRVDGPLSDTNISDIEVRQVQAIVLGLYPGAIVNIGGVMSECRCEDGPACTAQVWVVAHDLGQSHGLMLSKIDGEWQLGPLQDWWLDYEKLVVRMRLALDENRDWNPDHIDILPWHPHFVVQRFNAAYVRLADEQALLMERAPMCSPDT